MDIISAIFTLSGIKPTDEDKQKLAAGITYISNAPAEIAEIKNKLNLILSKLENAENDEKN